MILSFLFIIILLYCCLKPIKYLLLYFRLTSSGQKCTGKIVKFEYSDYLISRNINIPIFSFQTEEGKSITGRSVYSLFMELNQYEYDQKFLVFYAVDKPSRFVVQSRMEVLLTSAFVIVMILGIIWLILNGMAEFK